MLIGILITIGLIILAFKVCGFFLKIFGKILGGIFSIIGYLLIGILAVSVFGIAVAVLPVILVVGVATVIGWAIKL